MQIKQLGIPYMGSKRKLASKIINKIILDNPKVTTLYDLFGGGVVRLAFMHYSTLSLKRLYITN